MKKQIALIFCLVFLIGIVSATDVTKTDVTKIGDWWGTVMINENNANGATVDAYINNVKVANVTVGVIVSDYYLIHIEGEEGDNIIFKINGKEATKQSWSNGDHELNLKVTIDEEPNDNVNDNNDDDSTSNSPGGGTSTTSPTPQTHLTTYPVSNQELKTGFSKTLEKDDKMTFQFNDESHSLTISNIEYNKVEIIVSSTPQRVILGENESKNLDLNDDEIYDLMVTVESINNSLAEIKIQSLYEDSNDEITIDNTLPDDKNQLSPLTGAVIGAIGTNIGIIVIIFIVLAVGGFAAVRIKKKK